MALNLEIFWKNRTIWHYLENISTNILRCHCIYAKFKDFHLCKIKDIWKALIFFKDLNINCDMMSLFSKSFHGLHIFKDFQRPVGTSFMT